MSNEWELHSLGCDYITLTASKRRDQDVLWELYTAHRKMLSEDGFFTKEARALGYVGEKTGSWFHGARKDGNMLRVSGSDAIATIHALRGTGVHCTRIDVQSTYRTAVRDELFAVWCKSDSKRRRDTLANRNWNKLKLIDGDGDGDTLRIGSREYGKYGRIYDKEAESGSDEYENCWRFEIEYKEGYAPLCLSRLQNAGDLRREILQIITDQMHEWAIFFPGSLYPSCNPIRVVSERTDVERKRKWLQAQVLPTLALLVDTGYEHVVDELFKHAYSKSAGD